jgi:hypothetical protein
VCCTIKRLPGTGSNSPLPDQHFYQGLYTTSNIGQSGILGPQAVPQIFCSLIQAVSGLQFHSQPCSRQECFPDPDVNFKNTVDHFPDPYDHFPDPAIQCILYTVYSKCCTNILHHESFVLDPEPEDHFPDTVIIFGSGISFSGSG